MPFVYNILYTVYKKPFMVIVYNIFYPLYENAVCFRYIMVATLSHGVMATRQNLDL